MIKISRMIENCPLCGSDVDGMSITYDHAHVTEFECVCRRCLTEFIVHAYDWEDIDAIDKFNTRPGQKDIKKGFFVGVGTAEKGSETL